MGLLHDLRFALRLIIKERWVTAVAVGALALGIGLNATVFTLVNAVLIRGLPFPDPSQLFMLGLREQTRAWPRSISYPDLQEWRAQTRAFADIAAFTDAGMNLADNRSLPEQVWGSRLTANAFQVLGQPLLHGRDFSRADEQPGAERVVILGHGIFKTRYGSDPAVLGRVLRVNGEAATIIGVMPEGVMFPTNSALWMPFVPNEAQRLRSARPIAPFGRLRADATRTQALAELNAIAARLAAQYPDTNKTLTVASVETFNERFNGAEIRQIFLALMGAVGFVLLIACANVANLQLSRAARRSREIAVRVALGASRWRIVRQLLVESVVLGFIGGALGLLLALGGVRLFDAAVPAEAGKPYWIAFTVDWVVIGYLAAICVCTGILFGLAPALQISRTNVNEVLQEGGRGNSGGRRVQWLSGTMVVVEIALTLVLLVGAGLTIRSFLHMASQDVGIRTEYLMTMRLELPASTYPKDEERRAFFDRLTPQLAAIPGAESIAIATEVPPRGGNRRDLDIDGRPVVAGTTRPQITTVTISPTFFETVGVTIRRGRGFAEHDGAPGAETVVVNQRFATEFFPNEDPVGRRIRFPPSDAAGQPPPVWRTIVGVSPTIRHGSQDDTEPPSTAYVPLRQEPSEAAFLLVRSRLEPAAMMTAVRRAVQTIDQDQPVFSMQTLDQLLSQQRWGFRVFGSSFAILAVMALALAAVGLYAVMAYSVMQRTQEIGMRMALGANQWQVSWLILRRGLIQLAIGLAIGLGGAWLASRALRPLLYQISPTDPSTFAGLSLILTVVALAACLIPVRRATRVDPLVALRND